MIFLSFVYKHLAAFAHTYYSTWNPFPTLFESVEPLLFCGGALLQIPLSTMDENKSTKTSSSWGGEVDNLSKEKGQEPFPQWAFIGFILHRNTGKAHQSLSGSKGQTTWGLFEGLF